jgi:hypothetical protein
MAATPVVNITIQQGQDFSEVFTSTENDGSASNLSGYLGFSYIKKHPDSTKYQDFQVSITGSTGEVSVAMTSGKTSKLDPGRYYYDIVLKSPSGSLSRFVEGMALVNAGITTGIL